MIVIPSINVSERAQARRLLEKIAAFSDWVHLDIGDGIFTPNVTWGDPLQFQELKSEMGNLKTEAHLMIEGPEAVILPWLEAGVNRLILHVESLEDPDYALSFGSNFQTELGLAIAPETAVEELNVYFHKVKFYQVLAVDPGLAGQVFQKAVLAKVKFLRQRLPDAIIEVDGGINPEMARAAKEVGADIAVSASYIFSGGDPEERYRQLVQI